MIWLMQSHSQSKSIPTFKLHRVIITILGRNVKFLFHFFSFFLSPRRGPILGGKRSYIGVISIRFDGPGHVSLGAGE